jgi:hypothetical protein
MPAIFIIDPSSLSKEILPMVEEVVDFPKHHWNIYMTAPDGAGSSITTTFSFGLRFYGNSGS